MNTASLSSAERRRTGIIRIQEPVMVSVFLLFIALSEWVSEWAQLAHGSVTISGRDHPLRGVPTQKSLPITQCFPSANTTCVGQNRSTNRAVPAKHSYEESQTKPPVSQLRHFIEVLLQETAQRCYFRWNMFHISTNGCVMHTPGTYNFITGSFLEALLFLV